MSWANCVWANHVAWPVTENIITSARLGLMAPPELVSVLHARAHVCLELSVGVAVVEEVTVLGVGVVAGCVVLAAEARLELVRRNGVVSWRGILWWQLSVVQVSLVELRLSRLGNWRRNWC